ncbi:hypothetical protein FRX31_021884 [Thalictrum thalictroides]|uniref:Uncharacterized protein n=1 Tax=Thalictrum thalictroides TaxID=46969 RepID=A0A7J6VTW4_THATH|nr:hypothetical protein FRX31_021884 [Thalictrum thalictroides]
MGYIYTFERLSVAIKEEKIYGKYDPVNPLNLFGANSDAQKIQLLPELKEYFTPKGYSGTVSQELALRKNLKAALMTTCRARNAAEEKKSGKKSEAVVEVDDLMPPTTVLKFNVSSKKRSRSGSIKISPEPQLLLPSSSSKDTPNSEPRPVSITVLGRGNKGKETVKPFALSSFVYMLGEKEEAQVMSTDSAFKNPLVARALNEGIVLEADAAAVRKQSLSELCSHINSCIAVLNANYQGLRLIVESGAEADLELKQVKDALHQFKNRAFVADQHVKHKDRELADKDAEIELLKESVAKEKARRVENHNAWKLHCDQLTAQLVAVGSPEEEETQVGGELEASTPQDSTLGPRTEYEGEQLQFS